MGFSYGMLGESARERGWGGGSIYQTFIKREKLGGRTGREVSGAFQLSGIVLLSFVLYVRSMTSQVCMGICGMRVGVCKAQLALLEKSVP